MILNESQTIQQFAQRNLTSTMMLDQSSNRIRIKTKFNNSHHKNRMTPSNCVGGGAHGSGALNKSLNLSNYNSNFGN
jgi:hypothetical protein